MSDFDEGLMIGLALGRKKGGGTGYYSNVFHDILNNYLPIYEYNFGTHFSWKLGTWIAREKRFEIRDNGIDHIYQVRDVNSETLAAAAIECYRQTIYTVGIVCKDNVPKYATLLSYVNNPNEGWSHYWVEDTKTALYYKSYGDYRLERVEGLEVQAFEPVYDYGNFYGYFRSNMTGSVIASYQTYTYDSESGKVKKLGERQMYSISSYALPSGSIYPYPRTEGGYSDLASDEWRKTMHELTEEIYETAGYAKLNYSVLPTPD